MIRMKTHWILPLCLIFLLTAPLAAKDVPAFQKGDRVAFIGDSITHGGQYHADIYLFYATRFPDQPFNVYNCGVGSDNAPGTFKRFESDIAVHNPNVATIMLGMNDSWSSCFGEGEPTPQMLEDRKRCHSTYELGMANLADALTDAGCQIILIKPSIYDQTAQLERKNYPGKNDMIVEFGQYLETLATQHNASIVDFTTPMLEVNAKMQAQDPTATIVGGDRVHPGTAGHFLMAYAFLKAQHMPTCVSAIELDAANQTTGKLENCAINDDLKFSDDTIQFTCTENALPYPLTDAQTKALQWIPFQAELNQELFKVTSLKPGKYQLTIDDTPVGVYLADQLAQGINLSDNHKTPQYQHAQRVADALNDILTVTSKLRSIAYMRYMVIDKQDPPIQESDHDAVKQALDAYVAKAEGKSWYDYYQRQANRYLELSPQEDELKANEQSLMDHIWQINKPQPHHWQLKRVSN